MALLRCAFPWYAEASPQCLAGSDGEGGVVEGDAEPVSAPGLGGANFTDAGHLPGTGAGTARVRPGLSASCRYRQKSRASVLVAWSHGTPTAHVNRNHRSSASAYDRWVVAGRPAACRSRRYSETASTRPPSGPLSQYGSHRSSVSTSAPATEICSDPRSRLAPSSSRPAMNRDRNDHHPGTSGES